MLKRGDWVKVKSLRKEGEIQEVLHSGQYRVSVGGLVVQCKESDLVLQTPPTEEEETVRERKARLRAKAPGPLTYDAFDLHGMRVEEAMKLVDSRVNGAILDGKDALRIMHGKGSGKLKDALHKYLRGLAVVKRFCLDEKNPGVTWVYF